MVYVFSDIFILPNIRCIIYNLYNHLTVSVLINKKKDYSAYGSSKIILTFHLLC